MLNQPSEMVPASCTATREGNHGQMTPLTAVQKQIWSHMQVGNDHAFRTQTIALRLGGGLSGTALREALAAVVRGNNLLQARFHRFAGGEIAYEICDVDLPVEEIDITDFPEDERAAALESAFAALAATRFSVEDGEGAARVMVIKMPRDEVVVGFALHPMIADPAAVNHLAASLLTSLYGREINAGEPGSLPVVESDVRRLDHWRDAFAKEAVVACLPQKYNFDAADNGRSSHTIDVPARYLRAVQAQLRQGATDRLIFFCALNALMYRYVGVPEFRTGLVIENRRKGGLDRREDLLPVDVELQSSDTLLDILGRLDGSIDLSLINYVSSDLIIQDILRFAVNEDNGLAKSILDARQSLSIPDGLPADVVLSPPPSAYGDLSVTIYVPDADQFRVVFDFKTSRFEPALVERFAKHFRHLLCEWSLNVERTLRDMSLVSAEELLVLSAPYPDNTENDCRSVHEIIGRHARRAPDNVAIICGNDVWTHGELETRANRLAHRLRAKGVARESAVAILVKRSAEAVMASLAVMKAGGAYIPVEPAHPPSRNHHILQDAGVKLVITHSHWREKLPEDFHIDVIELDRLLLGAEPGSAPETEIHPRQLAYIMYTSGSTGLPKGVAVEHGALTNHNQATSRVYEMSSESRELPFLPFSSDGGHERWMVPLMEGGSIVIPDQPLWTPQQTFAAMQEHGVNNASIPTTYLQQLAEWAELSGEAPPMRLYSFGGEGLPQPTFDLMSKVLRSQILINGYGPTETIMTPMLWKVRPGDRFEGAYAPIGRAVGDRRVYVLDPDLNPCPIGVVGELYIGGKGMARGYVGRPRTTAECFVPDPFGPSGGRLYRTGDLTRWREDGTVEFVGRVDLQVKLRGYRIEIGEIEAALLNQDGVGECLVLLREDDGQKALVGYAVPERGTELDDRLLLRGLQNVLPDYMVPSAVVVLEKLPTNPSAKVDRSALPRPVPADRKIVPPDTPLEEELVAIWKDVLKLGELGVQDSFFDIGGHSLAALKILHALKVRNPGDKTTIADLFNNLTIRGLARQIEMGGDATGSQVIRLRAAGENPVLYCFPGLLVSTREYVRLVDFLGPQQPATGFICHSLSKDKALNVSVSKIVDQYASHIRRKSTGKPCAFLGWSWGGLLAYEAAHMLADEIDLRLIGMVDVCDLGTDFALGAVPQFASGEREHLKEMVEEWLDRTAMRRQWDELLGVMDQLAYDQFLKFIGNEKEELPTDGPEISSREHTFWVLIDNALVFRQHVIKPHDCPIHSWTAEDSLSRGLNLIDWRRYSRFANPAEIIPDTNHLHIIGARAFHQRFAARLQAAFTSAPPQAATAASFTSSQ